ncbi:MAG TPA: hypothetical protein VM888_06470 [Chitinophagaceae bacterium]|jgi:hypothetical protein|nr:hypothetical protein [Chitinophagaceae bacterium]
MIQSNPDIRSEKNLHGADISMPHARLDMAASFISISWGSVFAGVLIAIVIQLAFNSLGFGLSTVDPKTESNLTAGLGTGTAIWYIITCLMPYSPVIGLLRTWPWSLS